MTGDSLTLESEIPANFVRRVTSWQTIGNGPRLVGACSQRLERQNQTPTHYLFQNRNPRLSFHAPVCIRFRCQCGMFIIQRLGLPQAHGPVHSYPEAPITDCTNPQQEADCQANCTTYFQDTVNLNWDDQMPVGTGSAFLSVQRFRP